LRFWGADRVYRALHRRLVAACRSLAKQSDSEQQVFYESLEELARPWLSLPVLAQTDRKIVADLLACCRRAERQLVGRSWLPGLSRWLLLSAASFAAASAFLFVPGLDRLWVPLVDWLTGMSHGFSVLYAATTAGERLFAAGIAMVLTAMLAVLHAKLN
jgi:hypothetical protein